MNSNIIQELKDRGFKVVDFLNVKELEYSQREVYLEDATNEDVISMLLINPNTIEVIEEQDRVFIKGKSKALAGYQGPNGEVPNMKDMITDMEYEVVKASE